MTMTIPYYPLINIYYTRSLGERALLLKTQTIIFLRGTTQLYQFYLAMEMTYKSKIRATFLTNQNRTKSKNLSFHDEYRMYGGCQRYLKKFYFSECFSANLFATSGRFFDTVTYEQYEQLNIIPSVQ